MKYLSTGGRSGAVPFNEAVLKGLADDGGLFVPETFPRLSLDYAGLSAMSFTERVTRFLQAFMPDYSESEIADISKLVFNFPLITAKYDERFSVLELFHGPTFAFKDFGARFLAQVLSRIVQSGGRQCTILVATSGDTGSAVADAFYNIDGIRVVLLYPGGKVSSLQEKQLTTYDGNITAVQIAGTFDDCQRLVKTAFLDPDTAERLNLSSANSINIARLLPQSIYYMESWLQCGAESDIRFIVPSGNLGNLTAGLIANKVLAAGWKFTSALNANDVFGSYLISGEFNSRPSVRTLSNAMDVGNPSNLARIISIYSGVKEIREDINSFSFNDAQTIDAMKEFYAVHREIIDPHTAVGFAAYNAMSNNTAAHNIILSTAHPAKFADVIENSMQIKPEIPERLQLILGKESRFVKLGPDYTELKEFLLNL